MKSLLKHLGRVDQSSLDYAARVERTKDWRYRNDLELWAITCGPAQEAVNLEEYEYVESSAILS
jgi:hypothetical protein